MANGPRSDPTPRSDTNLDAPLTASPQATPPGADEPLSLAPGARPVPDYQLVRLLGRGGFGEVWKATGPGGFPVALKFVRLGDKTATVELRSLEVIKDIRHPHLLGLFGAWQREGLLIIAMELADGAVLDLLREAQRQGRPGIPPDELLRLMRGVAEGVDHLNARGIQHRDIKPQNLLLVGGGVKVADFGLAKLLEQTIASASGSMTPAYAAPEFLKGQASRWSDQYALAVTYCMLRSGRLPFEGNPLQMMAGHAMHPPDLTMLPEPERPAVERALAKEPRQRWPSCGAFLDILEVAVAGKASAVVKQPPAVQHPSSPVAGPKPAARPPRHAETRPGQPQVVENSSGMKFVLIPAGKFWMGSPSSEGGRYDDEEQHPVEITTAFYLGTYTVTQEQYEKVLGRDRNLSFFREGRGGGPNHPVENVTWFDAVEFCNQLSAQERRTACYQLTQVQRFPDQGISHAEVKVLRGNGYRLPTEAEWEYACREGGPFSRDTLPFHFRTNRASEWANFNGKNPYDGTKDGTYLRRTTPVGYYRKPNGFGLFDMHGNVWEWCQDWYHKDYHRLGVKQDPRGPEKGTSRVARGGSWNSYGRDCRAAYRVWYMPGIRNLDIGFRVVVQPGMRTL